MHSSTQPHYYESDDINVVAQSNGGDFITVIVICFIIAFVCAFPGGFTQGSLNKRK
jgi:hypothetical protein